MPQPALPDSPDVGAQVTGNVYAGSQDSSTSSRPLTSRKNTLPTDEQIPQTKRILGIIPNFRAASTGQVLPPQSAKGKFTTATEDSFDYSAFVLPAALAGYSMATHATPGFHQGRRLWPLFLA
jgi:hypothetical protein